MLLAVTSPPKYSFDIKPPNDFSASRAPSIPSVLSTPPPERGLTSTYFSTAPSAASSTAARMTTPHRGLPPPAPLTLPDPSRLPPPVPTQSHSNPNLPAPPPQWHGMEEPMRNWLATKAEEEKRKQEEERTQQEQLRLEQKKIEREMLSETIRYGVSPTLLPVLFLALAGAGAAGAGAEMLQQYIAQLTSPQAQYPETGRERAYSQSQQGGYSSQSVPPTPVGGPFASFAGARAGTGSGPPSARATHFGTTLPRAVAESGPAGPGSSQQIPQQEQQPILFHHWQPPSSQVDGTGGNGQGASTSQTDYASSPKKRKAPGAHQPVPPPSSALRYSESTSHRRTTGHTRQRSDVSARGAPLPPSEERITRPRAETIATEHSSSANSPQWQQHRYPQPPQLQAARPPEAPSENASFPNYEPPSRRPSQHASSGSAARTPVSEEHARSREDVEMSER
jgi:hypothetical protein